MQRRAFLRGALSLAALLALPAGARERPQPFQLARELRRLAGQGLLDAGTGDPNFVHQPARQSWAALTRVATTLAGEQPFERLPPQGLAGRFRVIAWFTPHVCTAIVWSTGSSG